MSAVPQSSRTVLCVVGARPNFMKIAPIMRALGDSAVLTPYLLHTGQHYDAAMSDGFFEDLGIPRPDRNLEIGSGSHARQTAEIMIAFEQVMHEVKPACVLVVGDVNSTVACALVAAKERVKVVHVEAGLRSYDRAMPEELNRLVTDQLSDLLFATERSAVGNLEREGIGAERVRLVGNVMIDTLRANLDRAEAPAATLAAAGHVLPADGYAVLTLHRPSNVDDPRVLRPLLEAVRDMGARRPVVFPVHPRTRARIEAAGLAPLIAGPEVMPLAPLGYLAMLGLTAGARFVMTDSGGLQEESTALGVPCLTIRDNTERPVTIDEGTNTLVGSDPAALRAAVAEIEATGGKRGRIPEFWDGRAAERIVAALEAWL
ncbi:UDP-N-acetylglucosamine 2-epimerase [Magnetospirillum sp. ME-1]|uniref:non-hydrolyzing UDP-N-acetylglucosamine 2-epimerase n=1 Tax=Magnetospirillum sp. ME-1 TaxID=1639348 RepID=UPI000A17A04D|nr:UDP-N-acetylglucosamine 2-epimerase (non-hydrolyzing) [Magnetospirillum sp. ME-1]ARJ66561.1 UDP-N-acetylglucosamine 2-epimerase [Magnetospirillum sp. ME-1]